VTDESIIDKVDGRRQGNMRWLHPNKADLSLHLRHVISSLNSSREIRLWKSRKNSSISNSGDQNLVVLKPDEDFLGLDFMVSIVEHDQRQLESVGLLFRVCGVWWQLYSDGGEVWDQYSVAGFNISKKCRCKYGCYYDEEDEVTWVL